MPTNTGYGMYQPTMGYQGNYQGGYQQGGYQTNLYQNQQGYGTPSYVNPSYTRIGQQGYGMP